MRGMAFRVLLALSILLPGAAAAVEQENFLLRTTGDLAALCGVQKDDPLQVAAIHLCQGFIAGAAHYHRAVASGSAVRPIICPPEPHPTRDQAAQVFVTWAKANPGLAGEPPVEGLARAFTQEWPCRH